MPVHVFLFITQLNKYNFDVVESTLQQRAWGSWWTTSFPWACTVPLWPRRPMVSLGGIGRNVANSSRELKGGDPAPLVSSGETTSAMLCPFLDSSVQERQEAPVMSLVEGNKDDEATVASHKEKWRGLGLFSPKGRWQRGDFISVYKYLKEQWQGALLSGANPQNKR